MAKLIPIVKAPRLAIASIKSHRGMEGLTLDADLYLDDKKIGYCIDDGNGGEMRFQWTDGYESNISGMVEAYIISLNLPSDVITSMGEPFEMKQDLASLVSETADKWDEKKAQRAQFSRTAKNNVIYRLQGEPADKFHTVALKNKYGRVFTVEEIKAVILKRSPNVIFVETFEQFSGKG